MLPKHNESQRKKTQSSGRYNMGMYRLSKTKNNQGEKAYYLQKQIIYDKTDKKTLPPYTYLPKSLKRIQENSRIASQRGE